MRRSMPVSRVLLAFVLLFSAAAYGCSADSTLPASRAPHGAPRGNGYLGAGPAVPVDSGTIDAAQAADGALDAGG
ncbi:MAG TPA: hypothetical protein VFS20_30460 [Longimicrobium sp.]|nr:hypothetical protein [Longimicrobium sp.]